VNGFSSRTSRKTIYDAVVVLLRRDLCFCFGNDCESENRAKSNAGFACERGDLCLLRNGDGDEESVMDFCLSNDGRVTGILMSGRRAWK